MIRLRCHVWQHTYYRQHSEGCRGADDPSVGILGQRQALFGPRRPLVFSSVAIEDKVPGGMERRERNRCVRLCQIRELS